MDMSFVLLLTPIFDIENIRQITPEIGGPPKKNPRKLGKVFFSSFTTEDVDEM